MDQIVVSHVQYVVKLISLATRQNGKVAAGTARPLLMPQRLPLLLLMRLLDELVTQMKPTKAATTMVVPAPKEKATRRRYPLSAKRYSITHADVNEQRHIVTGSYERW